MSADFLLIDNSNSFTKFALGTRKEVGVSRKLATRTITPDSLKNVLSGWKWETAVICSVVPEVGERIVEYIDPAPVLRVTARVKLGVGVDYPKPATIGADRLANAAAAWARFGGPVVVVDFGTAVSFDVISAAGKYIGGVIAPGLEAMTHYLHSRTALLPEIVLAEPPSAIGKSTKHAMLSGAVHGYRGLVREILQEVAGELGKPRKLAVVATGGYAELIAAKLPEIRTVVPELTLDGLRIIGALNT
ncbi:MAG: type III pantothenate kinase [Chthoniobacter sp.]|nr:type III pantothenate kinase [Chthoniobacter sp.]